jgi:hypothetical protein
MLSTLEVAERQRPLRLERCPECGSDELVTDGDSGEVICSKCGLVIRDLRLARARSTHNLGTNQRAFVTLRQPAFNRVRQILQAFVGGRVQLAS